MLQDPECDGLMEKYKDADRPETRCLRGLRRRPGFDQLGGSQGDIYETVLPRRTDTSAPPSPDISPVPAENIAVKSLLAGLEHPEDWRDEQWRLKEKRSTWESSLPPNFDNHPNHVTPGHSLEYINQGTPAPKKKKEDFNVSTKHKRRTSAQ